MCFNQFGTCHIDPAWRGDAPMDFFARLRCGLDFGAFEDSVSIKLQTDTAALLLFFLPSIL